MKVLVIFASHRIGGKNAEIEKAMCGYADSFEFDFVHLANCKIEGCTACNRCGESGYCVLPQSEGDRFQEIYEKMVSADAIFIISPVYAPIPSRLTAIFERLTSVLFNAGLINTDNNPLLNKKTAIFSYCSSGICDETPIKLIFDRFVMKNLSTYSYLNKSLYPKDEFNDITEYVIKTLEKLA